MKKGLGDKVLGWFVVQEDDANTDAPAPAPAPARAPARAPAVVAGQIHDARAFGAVYRAAGVDDGERERLTKVLSLIESLPDEASAEVKRSIVAASLEAFGVSIDGILVTGEGALSALDGHVVSGQHRTKEVVAQGESRIAELSAEIDEVRRPMDVQRAAQQELTRAVTTEKARVRVVLNFFDHGTSGRSASDTAPRLARVK
jgi:hypothetical protein